MTLNHLPLTESTLKIIAKANELERIVRDGRISDLCEALGTIECEAREAGYIVNDMIWPRK
jgi:hypothetical protein